MTIGRIRCVLINDGMECKVLFIKELEVEESFRGLGLGLLMVL